MLGDHPLTSLFFYFFIYSKGTIYLISSKVKMFRIRQLSVLNHPDGCWAITHPHTHHDGAGTSRFFSLPSPISSADPIRFGSAAKRKDLPFYPIIIFYRDQHGLNIISRHPYRMSIQVICTVSIVIEIPCSYYR